MSWSGRGCAPSTVRNAVLPLRAIYRRALQRDELTVNPTLKLALPAVRQRRERVARPAEADALLAALPSRHGRSGRPPSTPACAAASCRRCNWDDIDLERRPDPVSSAAGTAAPA